MIPPLRIGLAGLGTVGGGVAGLLARNAELLAARAGRPLRLVAASARDIARDRGLPLDGVRLVADPQALVDDPEVDVIVEVIGGAEGAARSLVEAALIAGKPVVTANKALLAKHGAALAALAEGKGLPLKWEAAVAGGIPAIKGLSEGLAANRLAAVSGILNGTCNYILTEMQATGRAFDDVLAEAQRLGYAEADPSFDVDGVDAAHKLACIAALTFGTVPMLDRVHIEGITRIGAIDIAYAAELGYRIRLLGIARMDEDGLDLRVHPAMIPLSSPLATVDGVLNAVVAEGDAVGRVVFGGRGAGAGPTASAVVADLIDVARGRSGPVFGLPATGLATPLAKPMAARWGAYYLRLMVVDRPGVVADVAAALRDHNVSLESVLQRARQPGAAVPLVLTTHETRESGLAGAMARIAALDTVLEPPVVIRIESM